MVYSLDGMRADVKKTPDERAGSSGTTQPREGLIIIFQNLDELRVWGPVGLREWFKRNRPQGRQLVRTGVVLEFEGPGHQTALSNSVSSSDGGGS